MLPTMKRIISVTLLLILFLTSQAQSADTLNIIDSAGRKQGYWIRRYPDNKIMYEGFFVNDKPTGEFRRYSEEGKLKSVTVHGDDETTVGVSFFHPNGFIAAEGRYINQKKEGTWRLYSQKTDKYLICEEVYKGDLRNGPSVKYYRDGKRAESVNYVNDVKQGEWLQFYVTGNLCIKANYIDGKLHGAFEVLFANGKPEYIGQYNSDVRDGLWKVYKEDGSLEHDMLYKMGVMNNPELLIKENEFLDNLEKNKGKISDPELTGTLWK
jgi:antitoxin component YwqK of YwqJK toxin-antitoxin module